MFASMLESMLPPGVTMEKITETARQLAAQMVETAQTIKRVEVLLMEVNKKLDEAQGATLLPTLTESNHDNEQRPADPASGPGNAPSCDGDSGGSATAGNPTGPGNAASAGSDAGN